MKKGFTLVELLAVIVILAIILAIAVPTITNIVQNASINTVESNAEMILSAVKLKMLEDTTFDPSNINETNLSSTLNINSDNIERLTLKKINDKVYITLVGKNKWSNLITSGTQTEVKSTSSNISYSNGANAPVLAAGMTAIKWNGTTWVDISNPTTDISWYNYDTSNKMWANARTADGSMWVWIPRYIYKISSGWHTSTAGTIDIQFTKGIDDNWNKSVIGNIDLGETANASNNKWTNHPAFTFGDRELTGIWVAKFEPSGTSAAIDIKPNVTSLRGYTIGTLFTSARNMEINTRYGWGTTGTGLDTHMAKNIEWGAIAYLTQSIYGKNAEVWNNPNTSFLTGCTGDTINVTYVSTCNQYNTTNGLQGSTTGNIYGIYDMSGGANEYTAAYVNNSNTNLNTYGASILSAENKYKDIYQVPAVEEVNNNYALTINKKGDAIYETSGSLSTNGSWYSDTSGMAYGIYPFFNKGNATNRGSTAGIFATIHEYYYKGEADGYNTFRPILVVGEGL